MVLIRNAAFPGSLPPYLRKDGAGSAAPAPAQAAGLPVLVEQFLRRSGMSASALGAALSRGGKDSGLVKRIRDGASIRPATEARLRAFIAGWKPEPPREAAIDPAALAEEIRRHCKARGFTVNQFGRRIGYPQIIYTLRKGSVPRPETLARIRAELDRKVL